MPETLLGTKKKSESSSLPDVSHETRAEAEGTLHQVGMQGVEMPVLVKNPDGREMFLPARVDVYVSLDHPTAKGIHMSRLYLRVQEALEKELLTSSAMKQLLKDLVESQEGLSEASFVRVYFDWPLQRPALSSGLKGWRHYPVFFEGRVIRGEVQMILGAEVLYSSTCPCSAALSRQLVQNKFRNDFSHQEVIDKEKVFEWLGLESSIVATPHAQRSLAKFKVRLQEKGGPNLIDLIDEVEEALATPVQTAVKRQDEQEFARLNGQNLMFCEDAARRVKLAFEKDQRIEDYQIRVEHQESLHPHNAVSQVTKGIEGGWQV